MFNPTMITATVFSACVGGLIGGWHGAHIGVTILLGISVAVDLIPMPRK